MLGQLEGKRGDVLTQGYTEQWMDDDFAPIALDVRSASCVGRDR